MKKPTPTKQPPKVMDPSPTSGVKPLKSEDLEKISGGMQRCIH